MSGPACRTISGNKQKCHSLEEARQLGPYDIAVVSLGTNDAANSSADQGDNFVKIRTQAKIAAKQIKKVADALPASIVYWVGPPSVRDLRLEYTDYRRHYNPDTMEILWSEASPLFGARALDSRPATKPYLTERGADGTHLGSKGGRAWASFVVGSIQADTADLPALPQRAAPPPPPPPPPAPPPAAPPAAPPAPVAPVPVIVPALPVQRAVESEPPAPLLMPEPARASSDLALFAGVGLATMLVVVAVGLARRR